MTRVFCICFFLILFPVILHGQVPGDSLPDFRKEPLRFNVRALIVPVALCTYGIVSMESDYLKEINTETKDELQESIDEKVSIDDISQYVPALAVYGLNAAGIKGKNNFRDRSIILGTSYLLMAATVRTLKTTVPVERPDGSADNSFPSGHTATAFCGAEFLWQEYKDVNVWIGMSGYLVAAGTGFYRVYNDKHWVSDVVMGAGIGILCTKIAYWTYPFMQDHVYKNEKNRQSALAPFYNGKQVGIGFLMSFY